MEVIINSPNECIKSELEMSQKLIIEGSEVIVHGLMDRINLADKLVFVMDSMYFAVGVIKNPCTQYKVAVFLKAGVLNEHRAFKYELGWLHVA